MSRFSMTAPLHNAKASLRQQFRERLNGMTSQQRESASRGLAPGCDAASRMAG